MTLAQISFLNDDADLLKVVITHCPNMKTALVITNSFDLPIGTTAIQIVLRSHEWFDEHTINSENQLDTPTSSL